MFATVRVKSTSVYTSNTSLLVFKMAPATPTPTFLIVGPNGWIGGMLTTMLREQGYTVYASECRMEEREKVLAELEKWKPTHVLNCAGVVSLEWSEAGQGRNGDGQQNSLLVPCLGVSFRTYSCR